MRFLRECLIAASCVPAILCTAQAQTVTIGETAALSTTDGQNGNLLLAQSASLSQAATIESLSFYVTAAKGNLILGIYDATGPNGGPGALQASTLSFTPIKGWNTASVATPIPLAAGNYWLAYLPSSGALGFKKTNASGACACYGYKFGRLPGKFSPSPASCTYTTWSFYATLATSFHPHPRQRRVQLLERSKREQRPEREPRRRRHGVDRRRQRAVVVDLRREQRRSHRGLLGAARSRAAGERRMRQRERGGDEHRPDREPLHRRHGVGGRRRRPMVVVLRRQRRRDNARPAQKQD